MNDSAYEKETLILLEALKQGIAAIAKEEAMIGVGEHAKTGVWDALIMLTKDSSIRMKMEIKEIFYRDRLISTEEYIKEVLADIRLDEEIQRRN